jgi:hypothetical protein
MLCPEFAIYVTERKKEKPAEQEVKKVES